MRKVLLIAPLVFLAGCSEMDRNCEEINLSELTVEQMNAAAEICGRPTEEQRAKLARENPDVASEIARSARLVGVTPKEFMASPAGQFLIHDLYRQKFGGTAVGLLLIALIWFVCFKTMMLVHRNPVKVEKRPFLFGLWQREVVTEYKLKGIDGGALLVMFVTAGLYSGLVYLAFMA